MAPMTASSFACFLATELTNSDVVQDKHDSNRQQEECTMEFFPLSHMLRASVILVQKKVNSQSQTRVATAFFCTLRSGCSQCRIKVTVLNDWLTGVSDPKPARIVLTRSGQMCYRNQRTAAAKMLRALALMILVLDKA